MKRTADLVSPFGRVDRTTFWLVVPTLILLRMTTSHLTDLGLLPSELSATVVVATTWLLVSLVANRVHDFGQDATSVIGALSALTFAIFVICAVAIFRVGADVQRVSDISTAIFGAMVLGTMAWAGAIKGQPHRNRYGAGGTAQAAGTSPDVPTGHINI